MIDRKRLEERPPLATDHLRLRPPTERDADAIIGAVGDWEVARCLSRVPHPYHRSDALFFLEHVVPNEWTWAITKIGSDTMIGAVGLTPDDGVETAELGYWLSKTHWGQGLATEAARAIASFGFEQLRLPFIKSGYFASNPASGRVLRKLGFVETGHSSRPCHALQKNVLSVEMCLLAEQLR
ncbi:GNAT family N-acetyltransferase [Altererythrobacter aquiaggeris]|uniref:GNAT family N-acetyltransferase n=1 Tax=Aestuarierythrobacter aquiaggeris TaxID=1898396 RepID=UPI0030184A04